LTPSRSARPSAAAGLSSTEAMFLRRAMGSKSRWMGGWWIRGSGHAEGVRAAAPVYFAGNEM
jgi:hypothetical protein